MAKTMKAINKANEKNSMKVKLDINPFSGRMFTTSELSRGTGIHKADKGKGSYTRKPKHKSKVSW